MRTVFVNPAKVTKRRGRRRKYRVSCRPVRKNAGITSFVRNNPMILNNPRRKRRRNPSGLPKLKNAVMDTGLVLAGATGGAALNRLGINHVDNFYVRNGLRLGAAVVLAAISGRGNSLAAAAAGAVLAPMLPDAELQLASMTSGGTANPHQLAAQLAGILEADLSGVPDSNRIDELTREMEAW